MDKISALMKEIASLKLQKEEAERFIAKANAQCSLKNDELAKAYQEFYTKKTNQEFVLINDFPCLAAFRNYLCRISDQFPLYEDGYLNIRELAEMIKHLYQFKTGKEYLVFTIGTVEEVGEPVYGGQVFSSKPHLYFMIGNDRTLEPYRDYQRRFTNSDKPYLHICRTAKGQNIIAIDGTIDYLNPIGIECFACNPSGEPGMLNYFDLCAKDDVSFGISDRKQIFSRNLHASLTYSGGYKMKGIKDVMDFSIHPFDTYIAKVLISTIIYKRNNHIQELSSDDYNHIFDVLFGEKVDIIGDSKRDIPRQLIYVPNEKCGM